MSACDADDPVPGVVGFVWIDGWTGRLITLGQWVIGRGGRWPWSRFRKRWPRGYPTHVFLCLGDGLLIEAQPGGAVIAPLSEYEGRPVLYVQLPLIGSERERVARAARRYEGVPYSFLDYVYLWLWSVHIRPEWLRDAVRDTGHQICSQLCDQILSDIGFRLFADGRLSQDVAPGDIFRLALDKGWPLWFSS